jgi:hypothetical protein
MLLAIVANISAAPIRRAFRQPAQRAELRRGPPDVTESC